MAFVLIVVGVTGSVLAFDGVDNGWLNPRSGWRQRGSRCSVRSTCARWRWCRKVGSTRSPFRIFVCVMGVVVAMLSITGVSLWHKKRQPRAVAHARRTEPVTVSHA